DAPDLLFTPERYRVERFELIAEGQGAERAPFVEEIPQGPMLFEHGRNYALEFGMCIQKGPDDLVVLVGLARAGRVHETSAGTDGRRQTFQHLPLCGGKWRKVRFSPPPADVRIAADRAEAGAGGVDEDEVEGRRKGRCLPRVRLHDADRARAGR